MLKLDFEKANDKVNWKFLQQTLRMKRFSLQWCGWIKDIVTGSSVGVKVNDDIGNFFPTKKSLMQGDPLSPILFNIVADMLTVFVPRARESNQVVGVAPHLVDGGMSLLQYADETVLFLEDDVEHAKSLKVCAFERLRTKNYFSQK